MSNYTVAIIGTGRVGAQFDFVPKLPDNHADALAASDSFTTGRGRSTAGAPSWTCSANANGIDAPLTTTTARCWTRWARTSASSPRTRSCTGRWSRDARPSPTTRAIICEKPMALSLEECDAMIDACKRSGVLLQINHNRRWHPHWLRVKELVDSGAIGVLNHISTATWTAASRRPWWRAEKRGAAAARLHSLLRPAGHVHGRRRLAVRHGRAAQPALGRGRTSPRRSSSSRAGSPRWPRERS